MLISSRLRSATAFLLASSTMTAAVILCPVFVLASAAETAPTVTLPTSKCVCHPGRPCICPYVTPEGKTFYFSIKQNELKSLQNSDK
jgi:hypothetical protein